MVGNREQESKRERFACNGNSWSFELPWPPQELSPNYRAHWTKTAKAKKRYRAACRAAGAAAGLAAIPEGARDVFIALAFVLPDRRSRDLDNLLARMKSGLDGLADAMGVDDRHWRLAIEIAPEVVKGGAVLVTVEVSQ